MLVNLYGADRAGEARYSPAVCKGCRKLAVVGDPDPAHVSTSYVERQNLTMRMGMRRFTRLTNGFSKKVANLGHAAAVHFMYFNFCRRHQTLGTTPAVAAGIGRSRLDSGRGRGAPGPSAVSTCRLSIDPRSMATIQ